MAVQLVLRKGTDAENDSFTGADAEVTVDVTNKTLRVHDGTTTGGFQTASVAGSQTLENKTLSSPEFTGQITGDLIPSVDVTYDLGSSSNRWKDLFLSGNTIDIGGATISVTNGSFEFKDSGGNDAEVSLAANTTDDLSEGSSNLYYTDSRVRNAVSVSGDLSYDSATGVFSFTERTDAEVLGLFSGSTGIDYNSSTGSIALADTTVTAGTFGSASDVPVITIDGQGRITDASTTTVAGVSDFTYDNTIGVLDIDTADGSTFSATVELGPFTTDDLSEGSTNLYYTDARVDSHLFGGTGVSYSSGTISIGQSVGTTDNVTFNDVTVSGDLTVSGTTTTLNTTTLDVEDINITVANGATSASSANGAGLTADLGSDGSATFTYDSANDRWSMNKTLDTNLVGDVTGIVSDISNHDTDDLTEGASNLYYTDTRARNALSASGDLSYDSATGTISFTERTDSEVRNLFSAAGDLNYNSSTGEFSVTVPAGYDSTDFDADFNSKSTDDLSEGTNLYYTDARVDAHLSGGSGIDFSTGTISHADTSSQSSVNNSGNMVIQDITLDGFGHITGLSSKTIDPPTLDTLGLDTNDDVQFDSLGIGTVATGVSGEIVATGDITSNASDDRLKNRLGAIDNAVDKVSTLSGFYFEFNDTAIDLGLQKGQRVGVSAQEVQSVLPEIVRESPVSDEYLTVQYEKLVPLLIEAIKDQQNQIDELKNKVYK